MTNLGLSRPDLMREQCYIAGRWVSSGRDGIAVDDPATGETIACVPNFGRGEVADAVAAAADAMPAWNAITARERAGTLRTWFNLMIAHQDDLAKILTAEQGKPLDEARGEILYAAAFIEWFAEEGRRIYGDVIPSHAADKRILVIRQPIGVTCAITPWNFPAAMITRKAAPALAAGCGMVIKPATATPLTALAMCVLAEDAGIPPGLLSCVTGSAAEISAEMVRNPLVRKISFTGSTEIGRGLMSAAAHNITKLSLELGGNAPFLVFDDADLDAAVEGVMQSKFRNAGQTCVCANRLYVQEAVHDVFVRKLAERISALKVGPGTEPGVQIGPLIDGRATARMEHLVADAIAKGARVVVGGGRVTAGTNLFEPTLLDSVTQDMELSREETFGPLAPVLTFQDEADAIAKANDTRFGLAAYFYARDLGRVWHVAETLEYGIVGINTGMISTEVAPFGGVKESGIGREGSRYGIDEYLEMKYLCLGGLEP